MKATHKTRIYIVRHGESEQNALYEREQTYGHDLWGKMESPLTEKGIRQVKKTAKLLRKVLFDAAYTSNLLRTIHTAEIIMEGRGIKIVKVPKIHEIRLGKKFFALSYEEREKIKEKARSLSHEKMMKFRYTDDGESSYEGVSRLISFLKNVAKRHEGETIMIANHGNMMRKHLMHLGWASYEEFPDGAMGNAGYYVLEIDGILFEVKETYKAKKNTISVRTGKSE